MKKILLFLLFLCFVVTVEAQDALHFPDQPALTPDGKGIIFAYSGDLWTVAAAGGPANRITALDGVENHPKVSPDGKWLAFSSAQYGNSDVYLMPIGGGAIRQLTFHDANDAVANWSWDSQEIYFTSNRYNRGTTYTVNINGGTPSRVIEHYFNTIHNPAPHPKTGELYFNESWESSNFTHRKRYKGPYNPEIKSFDLKTKSVTVHTDYEGKDMWPMIDKSGNIFFVSDRYNEEYNLYKMESGKAKRLTKFNSSVFAPSISADGSAIVFIKDYQLHLMNTASGKTKPVSVQLSAFVGLSKIADFSTDKNVDYFDVAYDGKKIAFVSRGELFVSDMEGKFIRQIQTGNGRVAEVKWLKDNKTLLFNQTIGGYQNLHSIAADGSGTIKVHTRDTRNNRGMEMSPDSSKVVFLSGRDEVRVMNLEDMTVTTAAKQEIWGFQNSLPRWSPDNRYILFTGYIDFEQDLFLIDTKDGNKLVNLTDTGVSEKDPVFSPDGKYIYFTSARHQPNYPRGGGDVNLYRLPMQEYDKPYRTKKFDELFEEDKKEKKDSVVVTIDFDGMMERMEFVGKGFGTQSGPAIRMDGEKTIILYGSNHEGTGGFYKTVLEPFESPKTTAIKGKGVGDATDLVTRKGKHYLIGAGTVQIVNLAQDKLKAIALKKTFRRTLEAEFGQMYFETWANLEENFYRGDFHGVDWPEMRDKYAAYLPYVTSRADLRRLTNDLLGELNTSHFGFYSNGDEERTKQRVRSVDLGVEFTADDPFKVARVIAKGPADRKDIDLQVGDRITAIDGVPTVAGSNREEMLARPSIDQELELSVARTQVQGQVVESKVLLHPASSGRMRTLRYDEWVNACQAKVDAKTGKKVAYVHMKNMTGGQLNTFMNEMVSEGYKRDGLILDLRWNTGGNVHDAVLQFLSQRPYLNWQYRGGKKGPQPNFAPAAKPIVLLINQQSLSDAEMTAAGFKELGLGTIVGTPTYRWIIFTSGKGLVDGSYRLPSWGCYGLDGSNLEKTGVEPEIRIDNTAADRVNGRDPQLDRAIEEVLKGLK
jgi:tricorn protease